MNCAAIPALLSTALAVFVTVAGCSQGADIQGTPLAGSAYGPGTGDDGGTTSPTSGGGGATSCVDTPPPSINPGNLPSCCTGGAAHCVPTQYVPSADQQALAMCSGGYCVPDPFITNPAYLPPKCKAFNGTDGVCLSVCVPQVAQYKTILTQGTCADTELCAPCTNPLTSQPSGACAFKTPTACGPDAGPGAGGGSGGEGDDGGGSTTAQCPHQGPPVLDPSTLPACGTAAGAHCLQSALVPSSMQSQLATCAGGYCVPDAFIEAGGNFIPPTCASLDGAEGRCLNLNIPQVQQQAAQLTQSSCQSDEKCVPCFSPLDGTSTGACNLSCDPGPSKPAVLFQSCCKENGTTEGKCLPTSIIPSSEQSNLKSDSCASQNLCVPTEMTKTPFVPTTCTGSNLLTGSYTGVCLSDCLSFGIEGLLLTQGSCDSIHKCAPCTNPLTGQPTGAPGCP